MVLALSPGLCTTCVCSARGGLKREYNPLELELQMIVSCFVGAGSQAQIWKSNQCF